MNDDEEQNEKQDEGLINDLRNDTKKANKSNYKMALKKVFLTVVLPILIKISIIFLIIFIIVSVFTLIVDKIGDNRITDHAIEDILKDEEIVHISEENGEYYFEIDQEVIEKYLEKLNKAYFDGYFTSSDPEQDDENREFVYDEEDARITEDQMEDWFQTKEYNEYLIKMMRAEIISSYPRLSTYEGNDGTEDEQGNKLNSNGNYVAQGVVKLKRTFINKDRNSRRYDRLKL